MATTSKTDEKKPKTANQVRSGRRCLIRATDGRYSWTLTFSVYACALFAIVCGLSMTTLEMTKSPAFAKLQDMSLTFMKWTVAAFISREVLEKGKGIATSVIAKVKQKPAGAVPSSEPSAGQK